MTEITSVHGNTRVHVRIKYRFMVQSMLGETRAVAVYPTGAFSI